ncbi:MAG: S9 family peptidase [Bacteroidia bacterium]
MNKTISLSFALLFSIVTVRAQKQLTVADAVLKQRTSLAPAKLEQLNWTGFTSTYFYIGNKEGKETLFTGNAKEAKPAEALLSLDELNGILKGASLMEVKRFPELKFTAYPALRIENSGKEVFIDGKSKTIIKVNALPELPKDAENPDKASNGNIAFTVAYDLYLFNGKEVIRLTNDGSLDLVYGKSVHREEFGINKGTFWSPSGKALAFYRMDQSKVTEYPLMDITARPADVQMIKYPMAGDTSHFVTVGVYNTTTQKTIYLKTGEPAEQYLTNIAWSPDEKHIYIAVLNRDQNYLRLNSYDAETGGYEKTLFEEKDEKYVQPLHPMEFVKGKNDQFIWQSERDGYNHIYLYDVNGKMNRQLTKGNWVVTSVNGFDEKGGNLFFTATIESPITRQLCKVNLKSGKIQQITSGSGTHTALVSPDGTYALDNFQSTSVPREQSIYDCSAAKKTYTLKFADNPLKDYSLGKLSLFTISNKDGVQLYTRMFLPVNFDSTKKYPVVVYQYGGPNAQMVNNTWNGGGDLWFQYMAEQGFVVFTLDNRGSENRGKAFEQATFRELGKVEMEDQLAGINFLRKKPWVDTTRMALFGWSFGGFMTTSIMLHYPDLFKVAIAGGPVIDWKYYEVMYTERYMDTPQANPEGYKKNNTLNYVNNLKGRLMLIHGTSDPVVVWQHSLMFLKACVENKKQVDYFVYPGHEHNVTGKDRAHLYEKVTDYIMLHIGK